MIRCDLCGRRAKRRTWHKWRWRCGWCGCGKRAVYGVKVGDGGAYLFMSVVY